MAGKSKLWALMSRDFVTAGDLYYAEGNLTKAAELYARGGKYKEAAQLSAESGLAEQAVQFYLKAGQPRQAGELLAARNQHKEAIQHFEQAKAYWAAAESALKLNQPLRAARNFERAEAFARSAECYESAGELDHALRLWEAESSRLQERIDIDPDARKRRRQVDVHRSKGLAKLGRLREAAALLRQCGMAAKGAQLLEKAGEFDEAVRAWVEAEQAQQALNLLPKTERLEPELKVRIYRGAGRHVEAGRLLEEMGSIADAAESFEAAEEWGEAGRLWTEVEEPGRAAELFYRANLLEEAADAYLKAKNIRLAADTYAKVGNHRAAADCLLQVEEPLRAAKHYIKAGDKSAASDALQSIPPEAPGFEEATLILVPLLVQDKLYGGALHRLKLLPESTTVGPMAVERLYWEARIHDAQDNLDEAEVLYEKALSLRREHRDLATRLDALRERKRERAKRTTSQGVLGGAVHLEPGQLLLDRYEILEEIGRGGMSRVYKAKDRDLEELVAIKTLHSRHDDQLRSEERLLREVQICRRIAHPNVVRVYDIGRLPGGVFVTMELLEGTTLEQVIESEERLPLGEVKRLMREILLGLREAHGLKIIHRDLKPANVAITSERAKIMDFGIAQIEDMDVNLTQTGQVIGSPMYMSPEQIQGQALDARSDLYSFGVLTYALLAGVEPYTGNTPTAISLRHLQEDPPDILEKRADLDEGWQGFILRLMAKKPEDRYQSAAEVLDVVESLSG